MATTKTVAKKKSTAKSIPKAKKPTIRQEAKNESDLNKTSEYRLAKIVSMIYEKEFWQSWGFNSFEDYGEKELKRNYRTMRNLSVQGDTIRRTGISVTEVVKVDKTVFNAISSYAEAEKLVKDQVSDVINEVKGLSFEDAKEVIRTKRVQDKAPSKIIKLSLKFNEDQWKALSPIIDEAMQTFNTNDNKSLAVCNALMVYGSNRIPEQEKLMMQFMEEKGLNKPVEKPKIKRKEPSHKGKGK